jgi:anti-sigma factor RsiW
MQGASFKRSPRRLRVRLTWLAVNQGRFASAFPSMRPGMGLFLIPSGDFGSSNRTRNCNFNHRRVWNCWSRARTLGWRAMAFGLPAALTAVIALSIVPFLRRPMTADLLVDEIVSGHVRSLMADHLTDVASSDKHTVKPWFDGKVDFSPAVVDLADHGFPLVGGRLEYLGNRSVAALVYARQKHFINLFVWPSSHEERPDALKSPQHGFNVIHWDGSEMTYWAVSDLNPAELGEFAELLKQRTETVTRPG